MIAPKDPPRVDGLTKSDEAARTLRQKSLEELKAEWDARLRACFDAPDFRERVDAVMDAHCRTQGAPKGGEKHSDYFRVDAGVGGVHRR